LKQFGVDAINEPKVADDNIITSWNPATTIDVALLLLELLTSKTNACYIKKIMGFDTYTRKAAHCLSISNFNSLSYRDLGKPRYDKPKAIEYTWEISAEQTFCGPIGTHE